MMPIAEQPIIPLIIDVSNDELNIIVSQKSDSRPAISESSNNKQRLNSFIDETNISLKGLSISDISNATQDMILDTSPLCNCPESFQLIPLKHRSRFKPTSPVITTIILNTFKDESSDAEDEPSEPVFSSDDLLLSSTSEFSNCESGEWRL